MTVFSTNHKALVVWFKELDRWDVKYFSARVSSKWPIVQLGFLIKEHNEKTKPFEKPGHMFRILGVTNTGGIFHAYDKKGKEIHQPYKRVNWRDLAYNPYRINVGSIGIVPQNLGDNYISPAYIVFSTNEKELLPEYVLLVLKADWFNLSLRAATAGSVRQSLTFDLLCRIEIPLPPLLTQQAIVDHFRAAQESIANSRENLAKVEDNIPLNIYKALGIPQSRVEEPIPKWLSLWWKDLDRWSFNYLARARRGLLGFTTSRYPIRRLGDFVLETMNGYCIKPVTIQTPHMMLKLNALTPAGLDLSQSKWIKVSEKTAKRFHIRKGDLLICRSVGSYDHVGKCALVEEDRGNILFPDIIIRVRFNGMVLSEYVREVIQTPVGRSYFQSKARTAVGMWKIGAEDILNFPIPFPPIEVQTQIAEMTTQERHAIAEEREKAKKREAEAAKEVEEMILGIRPIRF